MNAKTVLFAVSGVGLIVLAATLALRQYVFLNGAKEAAGRVMETPFGGSHPRVEFALPNGRTIKYSQGGLIFGYRSGDEVRVLYDERDPDGSACLHAFGALWGASIMLLLLGLVLIAVIVL